MTLEQFFIALKNTPESIQFNDTISAIDSAYHFTPTAFKNGILNNEAGQNSGSCKIFSFAQIHGLTEEQTLTCFGDFYRIDVLQHPTAIDHQNIRNFMQSGWPGVQFNNTALNVK
jgi:hypothetical protein